MHTENCLNCGHSIDNRFCPSCGQKTDTHAITMKHLFLHDMVHGVWHLERGILFTMKEVLLRPGQAALDYISGKRVRYYNVFYLILLVITLLVLINQVQANAQAPNKMLDTLAPHVRLLLFAFIPAFALNGLLLFKKLRLNYAAHIIIGGVAQLGVLLMALPFFLLRTVLAESWPVTMTCVRLSFLALMLAYPAYTYANAVKKHYPWYEILWRTLLFYLLFFIEFAIGITVLALALGF